MTTDFNWRKPDLQHNMDANRLPVGQPVENWQACPWPPRESMSGRYCRLEPFDLDKHTDGLFESFSVDTDARNWTYLPYGPFDTVSDLNSWCQAYCTEKDPLFHTVFDLDTGQPVGMASYLRITPDVGVIEVGHIHFSPLMQGTRMSTEAMYLMMRRVFDELGYRRYEWKCDALNAPSNRAALRFGFQFEGIFRQATMYKGRNRDTAWYGITDQDWPRLKAGYESWLSKENFDAEGKQIRSLKSCFDTA